jgi:ribosomal protein L7Ae-like RNA K-turn-binding protein
VTRETSDRDYGKLLGLIGLGARARGVVIGVEQVRRAAFDRSLSLAVVAPDVSEHSLRKVVPLLRARGVRVVRGPAASALGRAVGRETTAVVGIVDRDLARGIARLTATGPGWAL